MQLMIGTKAPDFHLSDQHGNLHTLSQYTGKWVLLYFYPKDDTPGCVTEACTIRDAFSEYEKAGVVVLGVSTDSITSHKKFAVKYKLPFTLLSDSEKLLVKQYSVWQKKFFLGRTFLGIQRMSFLIDPKGTIAKVYEKVKPEKHAGEVLADIAKLSKK